MDYVFDLKDLPDAICVVDLVGDILKFNEEFKNQFSDIRNIKQLVDEHRFVCMQTKDKWEGNIITDSDYLHIKTRRVTDYIVICISSKASPSQLLLQLYPKTLISLLSQNNRRVSLESTGKLHKSATIIFADIVGFTFISSQLAPAVVMNLVSQLFNKFDRLCTEFGVYKYETVGDCYVCVCGLMDSMQDGTYEFLDDDMVVQNHSEIAVNLAIAMMEESNNIMNPVLPNESIKLKIGINTGPIASGIISSCVPKLCLFGDTMNVASRMESTCIPGNIQISPETYTSLSYDLRSIFSKRDDVYLKGKGSISTWIYDWHAELKN